MAKRDTRVIGGGTFESFQSGFACNSISLDDGLWVYPLCDQLLRFSQEFGSQNYDAGRAIANFIVLHFRDVNEDLSSRVIQLNGFQDCGTIVGDIDFSVPNGECAKLRDVRFETVSLIWNGSHETAAKANYFGLEFDMGADGTRAFGELPRVHLRFRDRKFAKAMVTRKTGEGSWQDSDL